MSEGLRERLHARLRAMRGREVVVIGDLLADEFIYGRVERVSREAPVLILRYDRTIIVPGGAGNAAANVAALGGIVRLVGLAGRDEPGRRMLASLPSRVRGDTVLRPAGYVTPVKTRILAGGAHSAKQQVVRIDRIVSDHVPDRLRKRIEAAAVRAARRADAVIFSDYGSGLVTPALADAVRRSLKGRRVPLLLDSRYDTLRYRGLTACTPNESEVEQQLGVHLDDDPAALERAGRALLRRTGMEAVLITRGSRGMALFEPGKPTRHLPIFGSDEVADVTGAGDTVIATLSLALAAGADFEDAARLANYAGGIVVMKQGTATVSQTELRAAIARDLAE